MRRKLRAAALGLLICGTSAAFGQTPAAPAFDVASVKMNQSGSGTAKSDNAHGQVRLTNLTLRALIKMAYGIGEFQLSAPEWLAAQRYDVIAKAPPDTTGEQLDAMMRTLLAERFSLATHRESRLIAVYALTIAKGGSKMHKAEPGPSTGSRTRQSITGGKVAMAWLADALTQRMDRPVVATTGLDGVYDLDLKWTPGDAKGTDASGPSICTAIQEQLGLKLEARKMPIDVLVVDHAEKVPVDN